MIELKAFQVNAVDELVNAFRRQTQQELSTRCVFKSPTGSGKTIMMAEFLRRLQDEDLSQKYVFVWASLLDLHSQSKRKLESYLADSRYRLITLDDLTGEAFEENTILFVNWHSLTQQRPNEQDELEWSNVAVRDREDGRSIIEVLDRTRQEGKEIALIVDESHRNYFSERSEEFVRTVIQPKAIIEVSATPEHIPSADEITDGTAFYVKVPFEEVVTSGLIKEETIINADLPVYADLADTSDEVVIDAALAKRQELFDAYQTAGITVNPLVLIQLPSESRSMSALDKSVQEEVEAFLSTRGITYENGKLAVWLADNKSENLESITDNESTCEVLIFKYAVAVGWDCPRAQILVMLNPMRSTTFKMQTVGRILRMPEAIHYPNPLLNRAFVFTNLGEIIIADDVDSLGFFKTQKKAVLNPGFANISLPSTYVNRIDYGDLTARFIPILIERLDERFGIEEGDDELFSVTDTGDVVYSHDKVAHHLDFDPDKLKTPVLSDVVIRDMDTDLTQDAIGSLNIETISLNPSRGNIERQFEYLLKLWSLPFAASRSYTKIKTALYMWFDRIGIGMQRAEDIQRIVTCSKKNQRIISEVINSAKDIFEKLQIETFRTMQSHVLRDFGLPDVDYFGEIYEPVEVSKYPYDTCYLLKNRSAPEKHFESLLEQENRVAWWYKNGENKQQYFSIPYVFRDPVTGLLKERNFFPDYLVGFDNEYLGIFETKAGSTATDPLTLRKGAALQEYLDENHLEGGIINVTDSGLLRLDTEDVSWMGFVL